MSKTAIDAPRSNVYNVEPEILVLIEDPNHALYDPRVHWPVSESMVKSIMVKGVIQPLVVRKDGKDIQVVEGRQRTKNAIEANKRLVAEGRDPIKIPVIVRNEKDAESASTAVLLNEIRKGDDVLTKAEKADRLRGFGKSVEELSVIFGVTTKTIGTWAKFSLLSNKVLKAVKDDRISAYDAVDNFAEMSREDQDENLDSVVESSAKSSRKGNRNGKGSKDEDGKTKGDSPVKRLRAFYRSELAMAALNEKERTLVSWFFGEASQGDLITAIPRLGAWAEERKAAKAARRKKAAKKAA